MIRHSFTPLEEILGMWTSSLMATTEFDTGEDVSVISEKAFKTSWALRNFLSLGKFGLVHQLYYNVLWERPEHALNIRHPPLLQH